MAGEFTVLPGSRTSGTLTQDRTGRLRCIIDSRLLLVCVCVASKGLEGDLSLSLCLTHAELTSTAPRPVSVVVPARKKKKNTGGRDTRCSVGMSG